MLSGTMLPEGIREIRTGVEGKQGLAVAGQTSCSRLYVMQTSPAQELLPRTYSVFLSSVYRPILGQYLQQRYDNVPSKASKLTFPDRFNNFSVF
jgi:hypothetical protein